MKLEYKYIRFQLVKHLPKTDVYDVVIIDSGGVLGQVKWFPQWRKYSFFPVQCTVYEKQCLRDIANFCEQLMEYRRG